MMFPLLFARSSPVAWIGCDDRGGTGVHDVVLEMPGRRDGLGNGPATVFGLAGHAMDGRTVSRRWIRFAGAALGAALGMGRFAPLLTLTKLKP